MNNDQPKVYCGNAKVFTYKGDQIGVEIKMTINELRTMIREAEERGWTRQFSTRNGAEQELTLKAWPMKERSKYKTHYIELAEPYRKPESEATSAETGYSAIAQATEDDELPF